MCVYVCVFVCSVSGGGGCLFFDRVTEGRVGTRDTEKEARWGHTLGTMMRVRESEILKQMWGHTFQTVTHTAHMHRHTHTHTHNTHTV